MSEENNIMSRAEFEAEIIKKAWQDPAYRQRLLENPKALLEEELAKIMPGVQLPENLEVHVVEETPDSVHIIIPVNPLDYSEQLSGALSDEAAVGTIGIVIIYLGAAVVQGAVVVNVAAGINLNAAVNANVALSANSVAS